MARPFVGTYGWEDFKPSGRQLASYDGEVKLAAKRRSAGEYVDWVFITVWQRNGVWTRLCLDTSGTVIAQGFGSTRKAATMQMDQSLRARRIFAFRAEESGSKA